MKYFRKGKLPPAKLNGKRYIGKKQYWSYRRGKKTKQMDWPFYCGSSKWLHEDIKKYGKDNFEFKIIKNYKTRGGLTYAEANKLHKLDTLTKRLEGTDERAFYNAQIPAVKFVPKEY